MTLLCYRALGQGTALSSLLNFSFTPHPHTSTLHIWLIIIKKVKVAGVHRHLNKHWGQHSPTCSLWNTWYTTCFLKKRKGVCGQISLENDFHIPFLENYNAHWHTKDSEIFFFFNTTIYLLLLTVNPFFSQTNRTLGPLFHRTTLGILWTTDLAHRTSYIICRAQGKMKMLGPLFKNH